MNVHRNNTKKVKNLVILVQCIYFWCNKTNKAPTVLASDGLAPGGLTSCGMAATDVASGVTASDGLVIAGVVSSGNIPLV